LIGIVIQARMGSHRLPGKILKDYEGKTLLEHISNRLKRMRNNVTVVIATSDLPQDDAVEEFCKKKNILCFRGDELNVLKRYYDCATQFGFDNIVRMTGDNPFPDIEELDRLIDYHSDNQMDFSENFSVLPIGVGMEIMSYTALDQSMKKASLPKHFEHADEYILDNLEEFRHGTLSVIPEKNRPELRLTVDTQEDYERACYILRNVQTEYVTTEQAILLCEKYESLRD